MPSDCQCSSDQVVFRVGDQVNWGSVKSVSKSDRVNQKSSVRAPCRVHSADFSTPCARGFIPTPSLDHRDPVRPQPRKHDSRVTETAPPLAQMSAGAAPLWQLSVFRLIGYWRKTLLSLSAT